jgi:hypothetical protein
VHVVSPASQARDGVKVELWAFSLSLGPECVFEWLATHGNLCLVFLQAVHVALLLDQAHRQLVLLHEIRGGIRRLRIYGRAERVEGVLRDNTGVVEPLSVRLHTGDGRIAGLVGGGFGDLSGSIALRLSVGKTLQYLDLFGTAVEILALGFDLQLLVISHAENAANIYIAHAITGGALPLLPVSFFLMCTHIAVSQLL